MLSKVRNFCIILYKFHKYHKSFWAYGKKAASAFGRQNNMNKPCGFHAFEKLNMHFKQNTIHCIKLINLIGTHESHKMIHGLPRQDVSGSRRIVIVRAGTSG
jgi:hypothetical protein